MGWPVRSRRRSRVPRRCPWCARSTPPRSRTVASGRLRVIEEFWVSSAVWVTGVRAPAVPVVVVRRPVVRAEAGHAWAAPEAAEGPPEGSRASEATLATPVSVPSEPEAEAAGTASSGRRAVAAPPLVAEATREATWATTWAVAWAVAVGEVVAVGERVAVREAVATAVREGLGPRALPEAACPELAGHAETTAP